MNLAVILIVASAVCGDVSNRAGPVVKREDIPKDLPAEVRVQVEKLCSKSVDDRLGAVKALGKMKAKAAPAVPFLIASLRDDGVKMYSTPVDPLTGADVGQPWDEFVWEAASRALVEIGKPAADPLWNATKDESGPFQRRALHTLVALKDPRAVMPLIDLLNAPRTLDRWQVIRLLGRAGDGRAVEPLTGFLDSTDDSSYQQMAMRALGEIDRPPKDLAPLVKMLKAQDRWTRSQAARTLGIMKDPRAFEPLIHTLKTDPESYVRSAAAAGLSFLGDRRAVEPIVEFIQSGEEDRVGAVVALGRLGGEKAVATLLDLIDHKSRKIHGCAAMVLAERNERRAVPRIMKRLEDPDFQAPYDFCHALRKLTGQKFPARWEDWRKWWAENREEYLKDG